MGQQLAFALVGPVEQRQLRSRFGVVGHHFQIQFLQHIFGLQHHFRALLDQPVGAAAGAVEDVARHGEHLAPLFDGKVSRDQRARLFARFDDDDAQRQPADDAVAGREVVALRRRAKRVIADHRAAVDDLPDQSRVLVRIDFVQPGAKHGYRPPPGLQRRHVGGGVHAARQAAYHRHPGRGQRPRQLAGHFFAIRTGAAGSHNGDGPIVPVHQRPAHVDERRRVRHFAQAAGIILVVPTRQMKACLLNVGQQDVKVHALAGGLQRVNRAPVQPGLLQTGAVGLPRGLKIAKVVEQSAHFGRANAFYPIEADPVTIIAHALRSPERGENSIVFERVSSREASV